MRRPTATGWRVFGHWNSSGFIAPPWALEHDPEKACPGLDPGWAPVFGKDHAPMDRPSGGALPVDHRRDPYPGGLVEAHPVGLPPLLPQLQGDDRGLVVARRKHPGRGALRRGFDQDRETMLAHGWLSPLPACPATNARARRRVPP